MSFSALFTLVLTLLSALLLISEWLRPDLVGMSIMVILGLSGTVSPEDAFSGFSSSAVMTILGISIISAGLHQTGVASGLGRLMDYLGRRSDGRLILAVTLVSAMLSLFMNNIAVVGVLLPAVMSLCRRSQVPPSRLLLPLAYGTTLGGMATLLTTSNIIVSSALRQAGYRSFGLLDFFPIGGPLIVIGAIYLLAIRHHTLPGQPARTQVGQAAHLSQELSRLYRLPENIYEVEVLPNSILAGRTIAQGNWATEISLQILGLLHNQHVHLAPGPDHVTRVGDRLLVQSLQSRPDPQRLAAFGLKLAAQDGQPLSITNESVILAELVIAPHSSLIGNSLRGLNFRDKFNLNVLAIWRESQPIQQDIADLPLRFGDALLVHGPAARIDSLSAERNLILLEKDPDAVRKPHKRLLTVLITLTTLTLAALGLLPTAQIVIAGAILMLLTRCIEVNEAYQGIEWKAIFLIAGMWPLSIAIRSTGLADSTIQGLAGLFGKIPPLGMAAILIGLSCLLSQFMSGQVASLVLAPLAISGAHSVSMSPYGMGMAVALGCSLTFLTPFGHPVNLMVMNLGGYTFKDYFRSGFPLTFLVFVAILLGLHWFWGL